MTFQPLTLEELIPLFPDSIATEMIEYIYKFYTPKFKVGQRCIRIYKPRLSSYIPMMNNINKRIKKQNVVITSIDFPSDISLFPGPRDYFYNYSYYPASEGFANECDLRALTKEEEGKNHWELPHDMESERSTYFN